MVDKGIVINSHCFPLFFLWIKRVCKQDRLTLRDTTVPELNNKRVSLRDTCAVADQPVPREAPKAPQKKWRQVGSRILVRMAKLIVHMLTRIMRNFSKQFSLCLNCSAFIFVCFCFRLPCDFLERSSELLMASHIPFSTLCGKNLNPDYS